jgi:hypothetical protein
MVCTFGLVLIVMALVRLLVLPAGRLERTGTPPWPSCGRLSAGRRPRGFR